jgi:hypothetical protein
VHESEWAPLRHTAEVCESRWPERRFWPPISDVGPTHAPFSGRHAKKRVHYVDVQSEAGWPLAAYAQERMISRRKLSRSCFPVRMVEAELFLQCGISNIALIW